MEFIETGAFTQRVYDYLSEEEYLGLQLYLEGYPSAGAVIPGSGGVRKLRWGMEGRGRRGGIRVIYYWITMRDEIWLLTVYAKNETSTIPGHVLKKIKEEIDRG
jgi:hypothetical protein